MLSVRYLPHAVSIVLLVLAMYASTQADVVAILEEHMRSTAFGGAFFVLALVLAVVLAPLAALPLIPIAATLFGPLAASIYNVIGWTLGGMIAFLIARYAGRPLLLRFVALGELARYERLLPKEMEFVTLMLLRMVIPVDVLSYAVGFLSVMPLSLYTLATLLGVTPFSFIFAYGSSAVATQEYLTLAALAALALTIFASVFYVMSRRRRIPEDT